MQRQIQALPWMGAATKEQALTKLRAIANKIGYPGHLARLQFAGDRARRRNWKLGTRVLVRVHRWLAKIGKPVDRKEWT